MAAANQNTIIIDGFVDLYDFTQCGTKNNCAVVMYVKSVYGDQSNCLKQALKMFISGCFNMEIKSSLEDLCWMGLI